VDRSEIASLILGRLKATGPTAKEQFARQSYFVVDDLLPEDLARRIHLAFPDPSTMMLRKSIRELKYVTSQMDECDPLLDGIVFAFQDRRVVDEIAAITGLEQVEADEKLYAAASA
jgi:hypothetical protein